MRLILCEKPSVAKSISAILGANKKQNGYICGNDNIVTWCFGHLVELAPPEAYGDQYKKWNYADLPIIPQKWKYAATPGKTKQLDILQSLMNRLDIDTIINCCDAGREGQLIFRYVYNYCGCNKPVGRLWISSLEESAIREGFKNLRPDAEFDNLYSAALCRSHADYIVGYTATRLFSVLYGGGVTLNVGRVQSPTLAMIVGRAQEIAAFKKEIFYTVEINCNGFDAVSARIADKDAADAILAACNGGAAVVQSVERTDKTKQPPKLYDLTTLQREANRIFGYTAQQTLDCVQALYEKSLCSYPRTDSRYITEDMRGSIPRLVDAAAALPCFSGADFTANTERIVNNDGVSDHHAILPTAEISSANLDALPSAERNILTMIAARLLCAVGEKHVYSETNVTMICGGNEFTAKSKVVKFNGWKTAEAALMASLKEKTDSGDTEKDTFMPDLSEGQTVMNVTASVKEGETSPPKYFTEDTILSAMENAGSDNSEERAPIGTPATRAAILEKLIKTGFIERKKKNLVPLDKGVNLISILPDTLKSPVLTARWENALSQVERGEIKPEVFMDGIAEMTRKLVQSHKAPKPEYLSLFTSAPQSDAIGRCTRCGGAVREGKKGFFCDNGACGFKLWKESRFWTAKKKPLTAKIVAALLNDGRIPLKNLYSEKTGKSYDATVVLDDSGSGYVNFKLCF